VIADKTISRETNWERIDPAVAWDTWSASAEEPWDSSRVALVLRRAGFGGPRKQIDASLNLAPEELVSRLLLPTNSNIYQEFEDESQTLSKSILASGSMPKLVAWWLHRMLKSPTPLVEKITLFWHGHFATGADKVQDVELMWLQNQTLRNHALGHFRDMVQSISKDPAMLIYLDSASNRKAHPNENYARELMELFCLGEGNYTEKDVQELARCFTGWEIRRKQFRFNSYQHDPDRKTILGNTDIETGEQAIDHIVTQDSMPRFIVKKLFHFFVCDEPEPDNDFLQPLVDEFVSSNHSVKHVIMRILTSRLFLSGWCIGKKVRSPLELAMELLHSMEATTNLEQLGERLRMLGQGLFFPPNVKGWEGGRAWINSSTLIGRANLVYDMARNENTKFGASSLPQWCERNNLRTPASLVDYLGATLFGQPLDELQRSQILSKVNSDSYSWHRVLEIVGTIPALHLS